jgi:benzoyl-CoA reductase/2-hydroxyglutaryl-CoA dehydratase subunit BcrC/BadD/HgdB
MIPVEEGNELLQEVIDEVKTRRDIPDKKSGRLLIWGSLIDNIKFTDLIESSGLNIIVEDTATGTRPFWHDIEETEDPLDGVARHYLQEVKCPRTFAETDTSYKEDLENRFSYLKEFAKYWKINGVFGNIIRNCDIHGYEIPAVKDYLESLGLPVLIVEQDYSTASLEPLRTRFQAFAETIG